MFTYKYNGGTHTDTSQKYMTDLGLSDEVIESIKSQEAYEESKKALSAQSEMISDLKWCDLQIRYHETGDVKRAISTMDEIKSYAIECRDYVHNTESGLVIVGEKPIRPQ